MRKIIIILSENKVKILERRDEETKSFFIRGEEYSIMDSFEDVLGLKEYLFRSINSDRKTLDIQIIYSRNVSKVILGYISLVFSTNIDNLPKDFNVNMKLEMINKDLINDSIDFLKKYFFLKDEIKREIIEESEDVTELEKRISELKQEIKSLKKENKNFRIEIEKQKFEIQKLLYSNKLNSMSNENKLVHEKKF
ncbi:hypothetical protein ACQ9ZF_11065 (plasmid) [Cetobacterium somerae]|uniref:hypothetical protein n=1 Tax=Cetobacterium somerae TaxID=188913 RepID=UPI003D7689A9